MDKVTDEQFAEVNDRRFEYRLPPLTREVVDLTAQKYHPSIMVPLVPYLVALGTGPRIGNKIIEEMQNKPAPASFKVPDVIQVEGKEVRVGDQVFVGPQGVEVKRGPGRPKKAA